MSKPKNLLCEFGPFRLDSAERLLLRDGSPVSLTPKAFETLVALIERRGRLVEKEELLEILWPDSFVEEHNLANNISTLRKALGEVKNTVQYIETVPKRGYRFVAAVTEIRDEDNAPTPGAAQMLASRAFGDDSNGQAAEDSAPPPGVLTQPALVAAPGSIPETRRPYLQWHPKHLIGAGALLLAIGASLSVYLSRRTIEPSPEPMNIVPFTSFPGEEYMPCFSPDGNLIAFNWNGEKGGREEDSSIYVKQIGSEKALRLTFDS